MPEVSIPTQSLSRIRGDRGHALRGIEIANRKPSEYGYSERAASIGRGRYRVPSSDGETRYYVDLDTEFCECSDHRYGHTCKHLVAGMVLEARRAVRLSRLVTCDGCGRKHPLGDTREITAEDTEFSLSVFEGDRLCSCCATVAGVA